MRQQDAPATYPLALRPAWLSMRRCICNGICCVQEVQDRIDGMATELSKVMKKDLQESGLLCQAQFSELCNQLASRKAEITAKTEAYQKVHLLC